MNGESDARAQAYRAAHQAGVLWDFSDWSLMAITGPDRATYLHSFCTNDIKKLSPGQGCEAFVTSIKGRILGHVLVFVEPEQLLLLAVPGSNAVLLPHLTKYLIGVEAEVHDRTGSAGILCLAGPAALNALEKGLTPKTLFRGCTTPDDNWLGAAQELGLDEAFPADAQAWQRLRESPGANVRLALNWDCFIARTAILNVPGYIVTAPAESLAALKLQLQQQGIVAADPPLFELLRIEAGFPWYGKDISEDNIAQEAGRSEKTISFTKGCYLGQEPIARLDAMGHTNRQLRGIEFQDAGAPPPGSAVLHQGQPVGTISSSALSPLRQRGVALAMLKTAACSPGTVVTVAGAAGEQCGTVYWPRRGPVQD